MSRPLHKRYRKEEPIVEVKKESCIKNLRPVEALYLLNKDKKEKMTVQNSLVAVLAYLIINDYIAIKGTQFTVWDKHWKDLRSYERQCMGKIVDHQQNYLLDVIYQFKFRAIMDKLGYVNIKSVGMIVPKFKVIPTTKFYTAIEELVLLKQTIATLDGLSKLDANMTAMSYAFPSIILRDKESKFAKKLIQLEKVGIVKSAAMGADLGYSTV